MFSALGLVALHSRHPPAAFRPVRLPLESLAAHARAFSRSLRVRASGTTARSVRTHRARPWRRVSDERPASVPEMGRHRHPVYDPAVAGRLRKLSRSAHTSFISAPSVATCAAGSPSSAPSDLSASVMAQASTSPWVMQVASMAANTARRSSSAHAWTLIIAACISPSRAS